MVKSRFSNSIPPYRGRGAPVGFGLHPRRLGWSAAPVSAAGVHGLPLPDPCAGEKAEAEAASAEK